MGTHRWIGYLVWALLFGALFAWEGLGLVRVGDGFPTLSDTLRAVMRNVWGRWALFALWLWFGWHAFVRGWHFLLRGPEGEGLPETAPPGSPSPASLFRSDVLPMLIGYLLLMGALAAGLRHAARLRGRPPVTRVGWPGFLRQIALTAGGGYLLLMAVAIGYYYGVAKQSGDFLSSAITGGLLLLTLALPLFVAASWVVTSRQLREDRRRQEATTTNGHSD